MFRGKESSNRIELSQLVQDIEFWCFGLPAALGVGGGWMGVGSGGVGGWGWGVVGGYPPHMCTHMLMHAHACVVSMIISCKWPPPLGESLEIPYDVIRACTCIRVCVCACMCMCVGCTLSPPPPPSTHLPTSQGGTPGISQNSIALQLIGIFEFSLKI